MRVFEQRVEPLLYLIKLYVIRIKSTLKGHSYTMRTLRACCSQSKLRMLKIRESSARALFLYTPKHLSQC